MTEREFRREDLDFGSFERSNDLRLVTALVVNAQNDKPLMIGWQNEETVDLTSETGQMVFYQRSTNNIWLKGETSGNRLIVIRQVINCQNNTIKYYVQPLGPTCHKGGESCFDEV